MADMKHVHSALFAFLSSMLSCWLDTDSNQKDQTKKGPFTNPIFPEP